jgi:hypothetical protein
MLYIFLCIDVSVEDSDLSLEHVGGLCLWITYNFIVCMCWLYTWLLVLRSICVTSEVSFLLFISSSMWFSFATLCSSVIHWNIIIKRDDRRSPNTSNTHVECWFPAQLINDVILRPWLNEWTLSILNRHVTFCPTDPCWRLFIWSITFVKMMISKYSLCVKVVPQRYVLTTEVYFS